MKLSDRIKQAQESESMVVDLTDRAERAARPNDDPLSEFKQRVQEGLYQRLGPEALESTGTEAGLRRAVIEELERIIDEDGAPLTDAEREKIASEISEDILGYGPIQRFLDDASVTEVMINSTNPIYIERAGKLVLTESRFLSEEHLRAVIDRIVGLVGRRVDESSPMVDARLPDGSRVNAVVPPLAVDGPALTIRKFSREPYQVDDLIEFGTMTAEIAELLRASVEGRLNVLITGGTGTGKTTLLNVLSSFIPEDQRIVTIEDAVELQLRQDHVVRLESRPPNIEGKGSVAIRDLVRNSLRMRPDRIVVGEVRGAEALDMLQAMNTGHEGSLSTLHANSPRDGLARLETMVLMAGIEIPVQAIREYISSAIQVIIHLSRMRDGSRRVTQITEVVGMEGATITLQDIFHFDHRAKPRREGEIPGRIIPSGIRPNFAARLEEIGYEIEATLFDDRGTRSRR
jgi:pilus assembly protein CpaF